MAPLRVKNIDYEQLMITVGETHVGLFDTSTKQYRILADSDKLKHYNLKTWKGEALQKYQVLREQLQDGADVLSLHYTIEKKFNETNLFFSMCVDIKSTKPVAARAASVKQP